MIIWPHFVLAPLLSCCRLFHCLLTPTHYMDQGCQSNVCFYFILRMSVNEWSSLHIHIHWRSSICSQGDWLSTNNVTDVVTKGHRGNGCVNDMPFSSDVFFFFPVLWRKSKVSTCWSWNFLEFGSLHCFPSSCTWTLSKGDFRTRSQANYNFPTINIFFFLFRIIETDFVQQSSLWQPESEQSGQ